ncbi:MAG TPA: glycosyltransferase family 4 protein [Candidatus Udaeobacter sp.]|nr:glycosyltransferase family 4 protein [Candidatus Udaeobacter sp.]
MFLNQLGLGGTEKAACRWARELARRGHAIHVIALKDGPRRAELSTIGLSVDVTGSRAQSIAQKLSEFAPDVIHAHMPGDPHEGDILGDALASVPKIPVVQTNVFGHLDNPKEDAWTDFRLFISWTSCVQAARRSFQKLNKDFFRRASVAVYPLDADDGPSSSERQRFRERHGIQQDEILFGRLSRPEPNKWTDLPIAAFRIAATQDGRLRLLLREPPPAVARSIARAPDRERFVVLPATSDPAELAVTTATLDVVLHTSSVGESFGYGIAEPMNYGKPVIANSTPWQDQAQIELVRHGECGLIASTARTIADAMLKLANDVDLRTRLGSNARIHIRELANSEESTNRLETAFEATVAGHENPYASEDLAKAQATAVYLDNEQFGHSWREQIALRPLHYRVRFHEWRTTFCRHLKSANLGPR